jgi:SnoaL-like domain
MAIERPATDIPRERPSEAVAADFVERFARAWDKPDPDTFLELFTPDIHLAAPLLVPTRGKRAAREAFATALSLMPELRADVLDWGPHAEGVFIEFEFETGSSPLPNWRAVDRFLLRGGDGEQRISYFDSQPLLSATLRHPLELMRQARAGNQPRRVPPEPPATTRFSPVVESVGLTEELLGRVADAWRRLDFDQLAEVLAPNVELSSPLLGECAGRVPVIERLQSAAAVAPGLQAIPVYGGGRERIAFLELQFFQPEKQREGQRWSAAHVYDIAGERIERMRFYFDSAPRRMALLARPRQWSRARRLRRLARAV